MEKQLINKTFYETLWTDNQLHPIQVLGEAYMEEQANDIHDVSSIRYAQGEVYFEHKDYEAAIFKWENVTNELEPWAKKNIADAYYEIGLLAEAEDIYTSVQTESKTLKVEVSLQLFTLYLERKKMESAYKSIKRAIAVDPDYPNVTSIAKVFYEEQNDHQHAVELAVSEIIRTESTEWIHIFKSYIDNGFAKEFDPRYFVEVLHVVKAIGHREFVLLLTSLWVSYRTSDNYFAWINTVNELIFSIQTEDGENWLSISSLLQEGYLHLLEGEYAVHQLQKIVPDTLENWLKISDEKKSLFPAAAIMAWTEVFPTAFSSTTLQLAEQSMFYYQHDNITLSTMLELYQSIQKWAQKNDLPVSHFDQWLFLNLRDTSKQHIHVESYQDGVKGKLLHEILEENILVEKKLTYYMTGSTEEASMAVLDENGVQSVKDFTEVDENKVVELKWPSKFLDENHFSISTSVGNVNNREAKKLAQLADGFVYVIDVDTEFTDGELLSILNWKEKMPEQMIQFILLTEDAVHSRNVEIVSTMLKEQIHASSIHTMAKNSKQKDFVSIVNKNITVNEGLLEEMRSLKLLYAIRSVYNEVLSNRGAMESKLTNTITFHEDILSRLQALVTHLEEDQGEKTRELMESYRVVKFEMQAELKRAVPHLLQGTSELIHEDSDFSQMHNELNEEMNRRIQEYLNNELTPKYSDALRHWLQEAHAHFNEIQGYLTDMSESFNGLYRRDKVNLVADFQVVEDWRRDIHRIISRAEVGHLNILNRQNPVQFMLKGAGLLFNKLPQNKTFLYTQYKKYIENEKYEDITAIVTQKYFLEFDLFEKSLRNDVVTFLMEPFTQLDSTIQDAESEIAKATRKLESMKANPEMYQDPLKLLHVRLMQYEFMTKVCADQKIVYSR
ncbi:tetratricopeptide repeat protein [Bacillus alkalisoli]|uniref:tetratricopeptide repeat protein n=1 Tax=Bacillus alkalisoli TaxID=2011008 RepID=UPI000C24D9D3|nr:hypothetical protein [Bacillus alkalisoli]